VRQYLQLRYKPAINLPEEWSLTLLPCTMWWRYERPLLARVQGSMLRPVYVKSRMP